MILVLIAAPLLALALPFRRASQSSVGLVVSGVAFFLALWVWHMPLPYQATFTSVAAYAAMHVTLFGSAIGLWRHLLHHSPQQTFASLVVGTVSFVHMGLLGAVLVFAARPLFAWHVGTSMAWNLTPLEDQELGGVFMWVPGVAVSLWLVIHSCSRMWTVIEKTRPA